MEDGRWSMVPSLDLLWKVASLRRKMGSAEVSGEYIYLNMPCNFFEDSRFEFQIGMMCHRAEEYQQTHYLAV